MKRVIITLSFIAALGLNVNAQNQSTQSSDGFFNNSTLTENNYREGTFGNPNFPGRDEFTDQDAPLGSGLLLLAGMGAAYALRRKNK
jgi:hypothetical protein